MIEEGRLLNDQADYMLETWREKEKTALELLQIVGELRFDRSIELVLFRQDIYDSRPSEVLHDHLFSKNYLDKPIKVSTSLTIAHSIANIPDLPPSKIDIGKLAAQWHAEARRFQDIDAFVYDKLSHIIGQAGMNDRHRDVVLYGFGRIGRLVARRLITTTGKGDQLRLRAVVIRPKMKDRYLEAFKRASLLRDDSVHGQFPGTVQVAPDGTELIINGNRVALIFAQKPEEIDYTIFGIQDALLIDNTGVWRDKESLSIHLRPGIGRVLLTAPGKGIPNVVHGINQEELDAEDIQICCAASCTTNAIVPLLKAVDDYYGIEKGHIETIHAYTSDQNLLDNFHKKPRRGRGAAVNMVLTSTGAASAVARVMPHLAGKLTGNAVRVPTPDVSLAILNLTVGKTTTREEVNKVIKNASLFGELVEQIYYSTSDEYVSSHAVGTTSTSVFDAPSTIVSEDGRTITLYAWYDNEYGYCCQVVRLAKYAAQVRRYVYY